MVKRNIVTGCDLYRVIKSKNGNREFRATYLDLWFLLILKHEFQSNWKNMRDYFCKTKRSFDFDRDGFVNHLRLLKNILYEYSIGIDNIAENTDRSLIIREGKKAKKKILEGGLQDRDRSDWIDKTPRKKLKFRAMRGCWEYFPESPDKFAKSLEGIFKSSGYYSKDQSWNLSDRLRSFVDKNSRKTSMENDFILFRAFLSVLLEKMNMIDDSHGVVGDLYSETFQNYVKAENHLINMDYKIYYRDLMELVVWEDFGLTDEYLPIIFKKLTKQKSDFVESVLHNLYGEFYMYCELDYQAEKTLTMLGSLYTNQLRFEMFVPIAKNMGPRSWKRITTMAEMAKKHNKPELALEVYKVCLTPGYHEKFLRRKYNELKIKFGR